MAPGAMIEGSKVEIEGEKCGLDMSSYEDLNRASVGGDCNGKDDYVFVNGSDAGSDDHGENEGSDDGKGENVVGELGLSGSSVGDEGGVGEEGELVKGNGEIKRESGIGDGDVGVRHLDVEVDHTDGIAENGGAVGDFSGSSVGGGDCEEKLEVERNGSDHLEVGHGDGGEAVENGVNEELVKENGEIKSQTKIVDEDVNDVVVDGVENGEPRVEKEDNSNKGVDEGTTTVLNHVDDDDDKVKVLVGADEGSNAEFADKEEVHTVETLRDEDQGKDQVVQDHSRPKGDEVAEVEIEPLDEDVKGLEPSESGDVEGQTREDGASETQLGGEVESDSVDAGSTEPLVGDAINEDRSSDNQQPESQCVDEAGPKVAEAEVKEQEDLDASVADVKQHLESVDSVVVTSDVNQGEVGEVKEQGTQEIQTDPLESEGVESQSLDLAPKEAENEVTKQGDVESSDSAVNQESTSLDSEDVACDLKPSEEDDIKVESAPELTVEETEMEKPQSEPLESEEVGNESGIESTARSVEEPVSDVVNEANEGVEPNESDLKEKTDLIAEVVGIQESPVVEDVIPDQATEETGSVNVTDMEISLEDHDSGKDVVVEESTNLSEAQAANETAVDEEDRSAVGSECLSDKVSDDPVNDIQTAPVSGETSNDAEDGVKSEHGENPVSDVDTVKEEDALPQPKPESGNDQILDLTHDTSLETPATNGEIDVINKSTSSSSDSFKPKISFGSFVCEAPFSGNDVSIRPEVSDRSVELTPESKTKPSNGVALQNGEANGVHAIGLNHGKAGPEVSSVEHVNSDEAVPIKGQQNTDLVRRPFYYLIRVPRCEDEKLREKIRLSELQVEEKTRSRDAVRMEYQKRKGVIVEVKADLEAAKAEERAARELVRAKRREIDESQSVVNLAKNAITVEDVQAQILNMEHRIQHETLQLKEEKQLVRDIKQMKNFKDQLYGNAQKQEEIKQALGQKDQVEEQLKVLRKELAALRDDLSKAEENVRVVKKRYDEESALLNESFIKFRTADTVRQDAYAQLLDLRKQWSEKNKHFRSYKDEARAANDLAVASDMGNLVRHCVNQVEKFMDLWNNNDEFRMEYTKYNARSTLRRLRTLDGRSLGPDEEPPSLRNASNDNRVMVPAKLNSVPEVASIERDFPAMPKSVDANPAKRAVEQKNKTKKMAEPATPTPKNIPAEEEASGRVEIEEEEKKEEQHKLTKEEEELARKAEQQRREEEEARLREQRKLEEKAKAQEALERKKRMAEKALARAQFRAQKEAEQKEKEREKRAKKKDKKRGITSDPVESEPAVPLESPSETTTPREPEVTEKPVTVATKKPQKPSPYAKQLKTTKSIPPPLRNRGKRRMQQWMWALATVVAVLALFFLGNSNFLRDNALLGSEPGY